MKVILSRKGFDSGYGGMPSPILPDGTMLSMPIPSDGDLVRYQDLYHKGVSYYDVINWLKPNSYVLNQECHLDPDLRENIITREDGWKSAFGQIGAAQSHLHNQGVSVGDIFLFFGWFRHTDIINGKLSFVGPSSGFHAIYGYMQVGDIITSPGNVPQWLASHPHACEKRWQKNNAIYIASDRLSINQNLPGAGCFDYADELKLTKDGCSRSVWSLPDFFQKIPISYNKKAWKEDGFHSAAKGQEFVFEANEDVVKWIKVLLEKGSNTPKNRGDIKELFTESHKRVERIKAPIFGISRLRMGTDGPGITTLVTFMRCPLRCKYCANPQCHKPIYKDDDKTLNDGVMMLTPQELYDIVKIDNIYFQTTGGGICFGGGEPTLYADFIEEFRRICNRNWKISLETSLYCSYAIKKQLSGIVDYWIVDVKSIHSSPYESYTGRTSYILQFLKSLQMLVPQDRVTIRVPRIPNYNDDCDLQKDVNEIKRRFGFKNIEISEYKIFK